MSPDPTDVRLRRILNAIGSKTGKAGEEAAPPFLLRGAKGAKVSFSVKICKSLNYPCKIYFCFCFVLKIYDQDSAQFYVYGTAKMYCCRNTL